MITVLFNRYLCCRQRGSTELDKNVILECCASSTLGLPLPQTPGALGGYVLFLSKRMLSLGWRIICTHLLSDTESQAHRLVWLETKRQLQGRPMANFATYCLCFPCISVYKALVKNTTFCICAISFFWVLTLSSASFFSSFLGEKKDAKSYKKVILTKCSVGSALRSCNERSHEVHVFEEMFSLPIAAKIFGGNFFQW